MSSTQADSDDGGTAQIGLTDTDQYLGDGTPENIEREFNTPDTPAMETLDIPTETIHQHLQPEWVDADDLFGFGTEETPVWQGQAPVDLLTTVVDHLTPLISEAKIAIHDDGWLLKVVDRKNVCMYRVWLSASEFDTYDVTTPGVIGVNISQLGDTLGHISQSSIETVVDTDGKEIRFEGTATATIPLIDPDSIRQTPDIPDLEINQHLRLPGDELTTVISRLQEFSTNILIETDAESSSVAVESESEAFHGRKEYTDTHDVFAADYKQAKRYFELEVTDTVDSLFRAGYLNKFVGRLSRSSTQEAYGITFGDEFPVKIRADLSPESASPRGSHLVFMLAPRIQSE